MFENADQFAIKFENAFGLKGNSDADVIFHSITNSISSLTGKNILGEVADKLANKVANEVVNTVANTRSI